MGETTEISWTDHTFNPWWGCTKVAPGCDNCYAAAFDKRTGGNYFNGTVEPRITNAQNWKKPIKWNVEAEKVGVRRKVFCGSMMDWCDDSIHWRVRESLWKLISETPMLDWQLLTKRADKIEEMLPVDWYDGYDNVWLGVTCEDRKHGFKRIETLQKIPAKVRFISAEPLLEYLGYFSLDGIDWVIVGGESGANHRPFDAAWAKSIVSLCKESNTPIWFKQYGGNTRDKGGCLIDGIEYKQWPARAA